MMSYYAWKVSAPGRPDIEGFGTLGDLEAYLNASGLEGASPSRPIIEHTLRMQHEGQSYYKQPTPSQERWSLLWIELPARC
ncbi:hypothetical protein SAMN03159496_05723 [Rhizobium sp. NFR07]|uniref:hypothetical protein n=1 Tax=Rhizobium sp. NFR07 TaxID=1566262 RepID=UPI0008F14C59|nr:hypothetical protein [Rhizobium sp. NFR07]SFB60833.1 hypothetical protein SAMN03159496_05723 [Rhizobium sp. NFR07]